MHSSVLPSATAAAAKAGGVAERRRGMRAAATGVAGKARGAASAERGQATPGISRSAVSVCAGPPEVVSTSRRQVRRGARMW